MKVGELVDELRQLDPEAHVVYPLSYRYCVVKTLALSYVGDNQLGRELWPGMKIGDRFVVLSETVEE